MSTTKVPDALRDVTVVDAAKITTGTIPEARITTLASTKLTGTVADARFPATLPASSGANLTALPAANLTGTIADARISASSVNAHVDLTAVRQDIAMLALYNAVSDNRAAYNLPFSFIDQFEDSTGITTNNDVTRNVDEFVSSSGTSVGAFSNDANTLLLLHMDESPFTDSSSTGHSLSFGSSGHRSSTQSKFGTYSFAGNGARNIQLPDHANWDFGTGDFTIESWVWVTTLVNNFALLYYTGAWGTNNYDMVIRANPSNWEVYLYNGSASPYLQVSRTLPTGAWHHYAVSRTSGVTKMFFDGTEETGVANAGWTGAENITNGSTIPTIGSNNWATSTGYWDEYRISNIGRYASNFTPNSITTVNATGTLISDQQTAPALTKMSGVVLVKDGGSSATVMGDHLKIYFCATGAAASFPSAWVEATSYTAVTAPFSTGVTMYKLGETTVPSGTLPTIRAVWASQTDGGYESQLHGWAMNY